MTRDEMERFIADICTTWPRIAEQWQSSVYAARLRQGLATVTWQEASAGLFRWVDEHNRPPTIEGLLEMIDAAQTDARQAAARVPAELPTPDDVARHSPQSRSAEDKAIATEALAMIRGLLNGSRTIADCAERCERLAQGATQQEMRAYWYRYAQTLWGTA